MARPPRKPVSPRSHLLHTRWCAVASVPWCAVDEEVTEQLNVVSLLVQKAIQEIEFMNVGDPLPFENIAQLRMQVAASGVLVPAQLQLGLRKQMAAMPGACLTELTSELTSELTQTSAGRGPHALLAICLTIRTRARLPRSCLTRSRSLRGDP